MIMDPDRPLVRRAATERDKEKFLMLVADGETHTAAAELCGLPRSTTYFWIEHDPEFAKKYKRARRMQADALADRVVEISQRPAGDMAAVQRNKLEIDSAKWHASKTMPGTYGEKVRTDHQHTLGVVLLPALDLAQQVIKQSPMKQLAEAEAGERAGEDV